MIVREEKITWSRNPQVRFEEIALQDVARLMEINAICVMAMNEECSAVASIVTEQFQEIQQSCADSIGLVTDALNRRARFLERMNEVAKSIPD